MTRKSISLVFLILLALSVILGGCNLFPRKASDDYVATTIPPEDEGTATIQDAATTTISLTNTPSPEDTQAPTMEATTPAATVAATEAPTLAATVAATVAPTPAATTATTTTEVAATAAPVTSSTPGKHIVQANENLYRIALRYGTTPEALAQANGITNPALIYVGQELTIPSGGGTATLPPAGGSSGGGNAYTVQIGDNLFRIALKYNYDQYYLARYNGISNPALIYPGQIIRIPTE